MTLRLRLRLAVAGGLLLVVLGVVGYLLIHTVEASELQQVDRQLTAALSVARVSGSAPVPVPKSLQPPTGSRLSDFYVATVSDGHRSVQLSPSLARGQAPRLPVAAPTTGHGALHPVTVDSLSGSQRWRAVLVRPPGSAQQVLLAVSLARVDATTARLRLAVWAAGGFVLAVLLACGFWLERLGLRPIAQLTRVAEAISAGDRARRVPIGRRGTEAAELGQACNIMLDELQADEDRLRQFVADASHELRTPVSAIRGLAELWSQGDLRIGQPLDDAMRRIGQESSRMAGLVGDLLLLAQLDERPSLERRDVDLVRLLDDATVEASTTHPSRQVRVETRGAVVVVGDEGALRQVVSNLVENALVHTPADASVTLRAAEGGGVVVLEVTDTGPGMDQADAARAFDRFWRADAGRTRAGSGLGLPIVAAIVAAHGGEVGMETSLEAGTVVRIVLPAAEATRKEPADALEGSPRLGSHDGSRGEPRASDPARPA